MGEALAGDRLQGQQPQSMCHAVEKFTKLLSWFLWHVLGHVAVELENICACHKKLMNEHNLCCVNILYIDYKPIAYHDELVNHNHGALHCATAVCIVHSSV